MTIPPRNLVVLCTLASTALGVQAADSAKATETVSPVTVVDTLEKDFGVHPGFRRNHAKGVCAEGVFTASKEAAGLSRSAIFSGQPIPVVARFSVAGGNPAVPDTTRNPRGMALKFALPGGGVQMMAMLDVPVFSVSTPAGFLANLQATTPDPATGKPDPEKLKAFAAAHPESRGFADFLKTHNPPASYAATPYYSLHAFRFVNAANKGQYVRWRFEPRDRVEFLTDAAMASSPPDFLDHELIARTAKGPLRWDMIATLAEPGDSLTDPTLAWPAGRKQLRLGTLELSKAQPQAGAACEKVNFDPMVMSDGIEPSDDPVLHFRSAAYAISYGRRLSDPVGK